MRIYTPEFGLSIVLISILCLFSFGVFVWYSSLGDSTVEVMGDTTIKGHTPLKTDIQNYITLAGNTEDYLVIKTVSKPNICTVGLTVDVCKDFNNTDDMVVWVKDKILEDVK